MNLDQIADSPYARELRAGVGRMRFSGAVETEYKAFNFLQTRGRVCAWQTMVCMIALLVILPLGIAALFGGAHMPAHPERQWRYVTGALACTTIALISAGRLTLAWAAWSARFEHVYPRIVLPLALLCHAGWAFVCSRAIFGAHPEFLVAVVMDVFAATFFSGLRVRQSVYVNAASMGGLLLGTAYYGISVAAQPEPLIHLLVVSVMAGVAGFAYERSNRRLFIERALLGEMAARDGLTQLKNRRAFDEHLVQVWQLALRERRPVAVLMIDVDDFKRYNDLHGHQAGDEALQRIALVVRGMARRPLDLAARYGGEEFAVIFYDLPKEYVIDTAERLRAAVEELDIGLNVGYPRSLGPRGPGAVTVSLGVGFVRPTPERSPQGAVHLADLGLYDAKRAGRNRVKALDRDFDDISTGVFDQQRASAASG